MKLLDVLNEKYNEVDNLLESDEVKLFGNFVKIIQILNKGSQYLKKKNFMRFLKGLNFNSISEEQLNKLARYIESKRTSDYLVQYIVELLTSKSGKACLLQGLYVAKLLKDDKEIDFEATCILGFLNEAKDFDITNIKYISEFLTENRINTFDHKIMDYLRKKEVNYLEIESLFELCVKYSLLGRSYSSSDNIEVEQYDTHHPLESGYRVSYPIEFEESYYTKEPLAIVLEMISMCNDLI